MKPLLNYLFLSAIGIIVGCIVAIEIYPEKWWLGIFAGLPFSLLYKPGEVLENFKKSFSERATWVTENWQKIVDCFVTLCLFALVGISVATSLSLLFFFNWSPFNGSFLEDSIGTLISLFTIWILITLLSILSMHGIIGTNTRTERITFLAIGNPLVYPIIFIMVIVYLVTVIILALATGLVNSYAKSNTRLLIGLTILVGTVVGHFTGTTLEGLFIGLVVGLIAWVLQKLAKILGVRMDGLLRSIS